MELRDDAARLFASHWLLGSLSEADRTALLRHARVRAYPARALLFRRGDDGNSLYAVLRGKIMLSLVHAEGRDVGLTIVGPGEVIGEIAVLDGAPRTADARAIVNSEVLIIERRDLMASLERSAETCIRLMQMLCARLRRTNDQVEDMLYLDKTAKLSKALCRLAVSHGVKSGTGVTIDLSLSQREIGNFVGLTRESVNKQLAKWRDDGLLAIAEGKITITDLKAFEAIADAPEAVG